MKPVDEMADWIVNTLLAHAKVEERRSRFADRDALFVGGREFFHLDAPGVADVRLGRETIRDRREQLRSDPLVDLRSGSADWVNIRFASHRDAEAVVRWAMLAIGEDG